MRTCFSLVFAFTVAITLAAAPVAPTKPNVLLILVDDLKPALGAYGDPIAITPHLDRLAARGTRFNLAYCNQAVCAPSRNHLMTGRRANSSGLYTLGLNFRAPCPTPSPCRSISRPMATTPSPWARSSTSATAT